MNDDLRDLDRRANAAARDLASRAAERQVPPFDAARLEVLPPVERLDAHAERSRRRWAAGAVAAAVVIAAGIGVAVRDSSSRDSDPAGVTSTLPRPFVATFLPDGLALGGVGEVLPGDPADESDVEPMVTYGPSPTDQQLGASVVAQWSLDDAVDDPDRVVPVGDRTGYLYGGMGFGKAVLVVPTSDVQDGRALALVSPTLPAQDLAAIAVGVDLPAAGGAVDVPLALLPSGWRRQAVEPDGLFASQPIALQRGAGTVARYAGYVSGSGVPAGSDDGSILVASVSGDDGRMYAASVSVDEQRMVEVRGHRGVLFESALSPDAGGGTSLLLSWIERPGELIRVHGMSVTEEDLLDVAEGLEPVSPPEWEDLLTAAAFGELSPGADRGEELGRGSFGDGTAWSLRFDPATQNLDIAVDVHGGSGSSDTSSTGFGSAAGPGAEPLQSAVIQAIDGRRFAAGIVGDDVGSIQLRDASGVPAGDVIDIQIGGDIRFFVAELPDSVVDFVALSGAGDPIGTYPVRDEGGIDPDSGVTATTTPGE